MIKIEFKSCIKVAVSVFALYLCIYYWPKASDFLESLLTAVMPVIIGAVIAYPLNILLNFYEKIYFPKSKKKLVNKSRRGVCITLAFCSLVFVVSVVTALVVPQLKSCIMLLVDKVPAFYEAILAKLEEFHIFPEDIMNALEKIDWKERSTQIISTLSTGLGSVMDVLVTTVSSLVSGVATFVLAVIFSAYLLYSKEKLGSQLRRISKRYMPSRIYSKISYVLSVAHDSFRRFIVAQCTEAFILGMLCTVGMLILRLPYAAMIGAVICVTAFIPVVGGLIGGGIGAFLILMESPSKALIFLIFLILLQNFEGNVIYPKVVGSSMGLPSLWVLAAVTVGGTMLGLWGMLLGVPVAATLYRLIKNDVKKGEEQEKAEKENPLSEPLAEQ